MGEFESALIVVDSDHKVCQLGLNVNYELNENGNDKNLPLIYHWEIRSKDGNRVLGTYVGKAKNGAERPLRHYKANVRNLLAERPYRRGKPKAFRAIHIALAAAVVRGDRIILSFLKNLEPGEDINTVERMLIDALQPTLNRI